MNTHMREVKSWEPEIGRGIGPEINQDLDTSFVDTYSVLKHQPQIFKSVRDLHSATSVSLFSSGPHILSAPRS